MEIEIVVLKYDEMFTKRSKDLKRNLWFSFPNDLMTHPDFFNVTGDEFKAFLWCVSICSKCGMSKIRLDIDHACHVLQLKKQAFTEMFAKLNGKQLDVVCDPDATATRPLQYKTIQDSTEQDTTKHDILSTDVKKQKELNQRIWKSYFDAYLKRYKTEPVRNAKVNSQISGLGKSLGEDAVEVVAFFVSSNNGFYLQKLHQVGLCLADAESLHTQWRRGRAITQNDVRSFERTQATADTLNRIKNEGI